MPTAAGQKLFPFQRQRRTCPPVTTTSADGLSITTQRDLTGANTFYDRSTTDVTVLRMSTAAGPRVTDTSANGTRLDQTITTTSADGQSVSVARDSTGAGFANQTETVAIAANGSKVDTISDLDANGTLLDQEIITTSASGLSVTTQWNDSGKGIDKTRTDVTVLNADGGKTETVSDQRRRRRNRPHRDHHRGERPVEDHSMGRRRQQHRRV